MTCTNCNALVSADAKFCDGCGAALVNGGVRGQQQVVPPAGQRPMVVRNPGVALLLSILLPGAGQLYNGQIGKGIGMLVAYMFCWALVAFVLPLIGVIAIWLWAVFDAYTNAKTTPA